MINAQLLRIGLLALAPLALAVAAWKIHEGWAEDARTAAYAEGFAAGKAEGFGHDGRDGAPMTGGYAAGFSEAIASANVTKLEEINAALLLENDSLRTQNTEATRIAEDNYRRLTNAWAENARLQTRTDGRVALSDRVVRDFIRYTECGADSSGPGCQGTGTYSLRSFQFGTREPDGAPAAGGGVFRYGGGKDRHGDGGRIEASLGLGLHELSAAEWPAGFHYWAVPEGQ